MRFGQAVNSNVSANADAFGERNCIFVFLIPVTIIGEKS